MPLPGSAISSSNLRPQPDEHSGISSPRTIGSVVLGFRQRGDIFGGVAQRHQLAPIRQHDRIKEPLEHTIQSWPFAARAPL